MNQLLTEKEAAALLGVHWRFLYLKRKAGEIKCVKLSPRVVRYTQEQLNEYIQKHQEVA